MLHVYVHVLRVLFVCNTSNAVVLPIVLHLVKLNENGGPFTLHAERTECTEGTGLGMNL